MLCNAQDLAMVHHHALKFEGAIRRRLVVARGPDLLQQPDDGILGSGSVFALLQCVDRVLLLMGRSHARTQNEPRPEEDGPDGAVAWQLQVVHHESLDALLHLLVGIEVGTFHVQAVAGSVQKDESRVLPDSRRDLELPFGGLLVFYPCRKVVRERLFDLGLERVKLDGRTHELLHVSCFLRQRLARGELENPRYQPEDGKGSPEQEAESPLVTQQAVQVIEECVKDYRPSA